MAIKLDNEKIVGAVLAQCRFFLKQVDFGTKNYTYLYITPPSHISCAEIEETLKIIGVKQSEEILGSPQRPRRNVYFRDDAFIKKVAELPYIDDPVIDVLRDALKIKKTAKQIARLS